MSDIETTNLHIGIGHNGPQPFDYDALPGPVADAARASVSRIREYHTVIVGSTYALGEALTRLKEGLDHYGGWGKLLEAEFGLRYQDTAIRVMRIYDRLRDDRFRILRNLPLQKKGSFYALTSPSTPDHVLEQIADALARNEITGNDTEILKLLERFKGGLSDKARARRGTML
jgi:hypothetical protein